MSEIFEKLKSKLSEKNIKFDVTSVGIFLLEEGNYEILIIDDVKEFIIFLDETHLHSESVDEIIKLIDDALVGNLKIVYKLRGKTRVSNQIQIIENGICKILVQSGRLISPFWKKKTFEDVYFRNPTR